MENLGGTYLCVQKIETEAKKKINSMEKRKFKKNRAGILRYSYGENEC